jgi:mRNA interferase MazF
VKELPDRGSLVWVEFSPHADHEEAGRHPAIVLTTKTYHERSPTAVVCPISRTERGWPMEVKLPAGLPVSGVVLVDQVRSIDREARHLKLAGIVPAELLEEIGAKLAPFLNLKM